MTDEERKARELQAERLRVLHGWHPIPIHHEWVLMGEWQPARIELFHPDGFAYVKGIRLFEQPHTVMIESVKREENGPSLVASPFDAAVFAMNDPLLPLDLMPEGSGRYLGEPLRYISVDWGAVDRKHPLILTARVIGNPTDIWHLSGYLVVEFPPPGLCLGGKAFV